MPLTIDSHAPAIDSRVPEIDSHVPAIGIHCRQIDSYVPADWYPLPPD